MVEPTTGLESQEPIPEADTKEAGEETAGQNSDQETNVETSEQNQNEESDEEITAKKWELGKYLIEKFSAVIIPVSGKKPCVKEWTKKPPTTLQELEAWQNEDYFYNLGLVLGTKSGIVGIDIDGAEGEVILQDLSNGDLPETVTYTTPGGGKRLLYRIPEEHKNKVFKKFAKAGTGDHAELALLGDGQQTVLPYAIHPNGGIYQFVEGKSFQDVELAILPEWAEKLMLKPKPQASDTSQKITPLETVCSKCRRLQELLAEQIATGLHEENWFRVICLFIGAGHVALARQFSELSPKHNYRSDKRIDDLAAQGKGGKIRCTSLGCSDEDIMKCFSRLRTNATGEIINSPGALISYSKAQNEKIGFVYDGDGNFKGINGNIFSRFILKNFNLVSREGVKHYQYISNYWKEVSEHNLKRMLRRFFNKYEPDKWTTGIEKLYWENMRLECVLTDELKPATNYISVANGLLNLNTFKLEPHNKQIFSTVQLPFAYNPQAACPNFMAFLNDIFLNDSELVNLMQEVLGYSLSCEVKAEKMFVFFGDGSNGKGVLCKVMFELAGGEKNVSSVSLKNLSSQFALANLVDKTLNISSETELKELDTEVLKLLASGDPIEVERKYENSFTYKPFVKLVFCTNNLPYTPDKSYGFERKLIILPFEKKFVNDPVLENQGTLDVNLLQKLLPELEGIFNFAIEGFKRLKANNFRFSDSQRVAALLDEFKLDTNPYLDFIRCCLEPVSAPEDEQIETRISSHEMQDVFREWCYQNSHNQLITMTVRKFLKQIRATLRNEDVFFNFKPSNGKDYFYHIKFTQAAKALIKKATYRKKMQK